MRNSVNHGSFIPLFFITFQKLICHLMLTILTRMYIQHFYWGVISGSFPNFFLNFTEGRLHCSSGNKWNTCTLRVFSSHAVYAITLVITIIIFLVFARDEPASPSLQLRLVWLYTNLNASMNNCQLFWQKHLLRCECIVIETFNCE